ncbi:MAG TPA: hypothetical protein DCL63_09055, partial [Firmicutes bacterium]|nr:hypothetical protein [Bacillota bacterium]
MPFSAQRIEGSGPIGEDDHVARADPPGSYQTLQHHDERCSGSGGTGRRVGDERRRKALDIF